MKIHASAVACGTIVVPLLCALPALAAQPAKGAAWPERPIRLIIPNAPGGNADIVGRILGQQLGAHLGQSVVIDNRPGASSIIGTELAVRALHTAYGLDGA